VKELNVPFSLFDFFAVLLPGGVGLFGMYLFINPALTYAGHDAAFSAIILQRFTSDIALITGIVLASYLVGQVLNALSELLIDRPANRFFGAHIVRDLNHHNVKKAIEKKFGDDILQQSARRTFIMIESTVSAKMPDAAATARRFIALAALFQSLSLALLVIGSALIRGYAIKEAFSGSFVSFALAVVLILTMTAITLWSYRRYKRMWSQTMCMSFVAWVNLEKSIEDKPAVAPVAR
jgi:hypothetical protein